MSIEKISKIEYSILSPDIIRKLSVAKIIVPELYDEEGHPVRGGLMDPRLGVIDPGLVCETCGKPSGKCLGHFGHIELVKPVFHIEFIPIIRDILGAICLNCSRLKLKDEEIDLIVKRIEKYRNSKRWSRLFKFIKKRVYAKSKKVETCPHCGYKNPKIEFKKPFYFYVKEGETTRRLYPTEIRFILERIPDKDLIALGFDPANSRPEWTILTVLPVPPVTVRPSIILETGERAEDDLTHKLVDIVRTNQRLKEAITAGAPQTVIDELYNLLQYHVATYINNSVSGLPKAIHRSGKPLKSLVERIVGKEGRIRYNLLGKRTNFSARAVISPDTKIRINEVGVPLEVAMILTVPERVTEWNIEWLRKIVLNGPKKYPGANYVISPDGRKRAITEENKEQLASMLEPGWIVERHLIDGDVAVFQRYPSLHRLSLLGHYIKVLPGRTFRLHPAACTPYNADFDGDEMNLHVPQTEEARAETELLLALENHLITPRYGELIVGGIQEVITGLYYLTMDDTKLPFNIATQLIYLAGAEEKEINRLLEFIERAKKEGRDYLTGKEIFSAFLPQDLNLELSDIVIENGELKKGIISSAHVKAEKGKLIVYIYNIYGKDFALKLLEKLFLLGIYYQYIYGITMSFSDLDIQKEGREEINRILNETMNKVNELYEKYKRGEIERIPGKTLKESFEDHVQTIIASSTNLIQKALEKYIKKGGVYVMSTTGARGKWDDLIKMIGTLGVQSFRGRLIEFGYKDRNLTIFPRGYDHPIAKGWVISSYLDGLKPWEMFYHALPGRDALMDTAIRTQQSGYLYRRIVHSLYEIFVYKDGIVRDVYGRIIQFLYGEDGIFPQKSDGGTIDVDVIIKQYLKRLSDENIHGTTGETQKGGRRKGKRSSR